MYRLILLLVVITVALSKPLDGELTNNAVKKSGHTVWKRFINPSLTFGALGDAGVSKMRTKRNAEECEKLELCRLHARSGHDLFSAFQLYFVNKDNARLWDHASRSAAECRDRFGGCDDYDR